MKITTKKLAQIKKFEITKIPIEIEYCRPIIGRLYAIYAWLRCIKFFKMKFFSKTVYRLAIPQFTEKVISC